MVVWCLTTSPENFARTAEAGWRLQGVKSRRRRTAEQLRPGDKLVYYVTRHVAFGATAEVRSEYFEDHDPIWSSKPGRARRPGRAAEGGDLEDYPWRVEIAPEVVVEDPSSWVPAEGLYDDLTFVKKWPRENWKLAFQGNIREWPEADYLVVRKALEQAAQV